MSFIDRHKVVRRFIILWVIGIITWSVYISFTNPPDIPSGTATVLISIIGLLSVAISFYQWQRHKDDTNNKD